MKRTILIVLVAFFTLLANSVSADPITEKIEAAGKKHTKITGQFTETRHDKTGKVKYTKEGSLSYVVKDAKLEMTYAKPKGDRFAIAGTQMTIVKNGKTNNFNLTKNMAMHALSGILTNSLTGQISQMAKDNDVTVSTATEGKFYVVTLTAKKKTARGYSSIVLSYDKEKMYLKKMKMNEWSGQSTTYEM